MTEEVSKQINQNLGWTTRDIMVTAIISIALGIIYIPLTIATGLVMGLPLVFGLIMGTFYWPIILAAYLIRKPGAAIFSAVVSFLVLAPFTPWGVTVLIFILTVGVPVEVVFLASRYKRFNLVYLMLAGAVCGLAGTVVQYTIVGAITLLSPLIIMVFLVEAMISGALWGSILTKLIGDAVFRTGVISKNA